MRLALPCLFDTPWYDAGFCPAAIDATAADACAAFTSVHSNVQTLTHYGHDRLAWPKRFVMQLAMMLAAA